MPLGHATKKYVLDPDQLHNAEILIRVRRDLGNNFEIVRDKITNFIKTSNIFESKGYTTFGMLMGEKGDMPDVDFDFCWETVWHHYPDENHCKRVLGTILMHCFALDDRSWLFVDDIEKNKKLSDEEIPLATQYFLSDDLDVFEDYKWPSRLKDKYCKKNSVEDLLKKFKKK